MEHTQKGNHQYTNSNAKLFSILLMFILAASLARQNEIINYLGSNLTDLYKINGKNSVQHVISSHAWMEKNSIFWFAPFLYSHSFTSAWFGLIQAGLDLAHFWK